MFVETKFFHKAGEGSGGGGGSDPHNKGYFATPAALRTAYPTAQPGDFAIVESTDTVWVWDSDTSGWKDGDTKGQVISVNNQTGAVTLTASDVGAATAAQGAKADTAVQPGDLATVATSGAYSDLTGTPTIPAAQVNSDWNASSGVAEILNKPTLATVATSGAYSDLTGTPTIPAAIQVSTMPTAAVGELDKIYQFVGTTDANYTNGYFYKCVSDGQNPATYSWTQTDVQPQAGGLPSQTGQSGKFLTTDGTNASWSDKPLVNNATGQRSIATGDYSQCNKDQCVVIGGYAKANNSSAAAGSVVIGWQAEDQKSGFSQPSVVIGAGSKVTAPTSKLSPASCAIGVSAESNASVGTVLGGLMNKVTGECAIQIGGVMQTNSETGTLCIGSYYNNAYVNYKMMDADGTIPEARLADTTNAQQGDVLTLDSNGNAVWQAGGGGGGSTALSLTLAAANWSNNTITVTATGVTASNNVIVSPAPASQSAYTTAGVMCTAQASDSLTFTCTTTPSSDLTVTVLII